MHAFITPDQTTSQSISSLDLNQPHPDLHTITDEKSIGIKQIRQIIADTINRPFSHHTKIYYLPLANTLTIPAQNALLKILEEPPPQVIFILQTDNSDSLLSTVQSRCLVLPSLDPKKNSNDIDLHKFEKYTQTVIEHFTNTQALASIESALKLGNLITNQESAITLTNQLTHFFRHLLLNTNQYPPIIFNLRLLRQTQIYLKANANHRLATDNLLLNLKTIPGALTKPKFHDRVKKL